MQIYMRFNTYNVCLIFHFSVFVSLCTPPLPLILPGIIDPHKAFATRAIL